MSTPLPVLILIRGLAVWVIGGPQEKALAAEIGAAAPLAV